MAYGSDVRTSSIIIYLSKKTDFHWLRTLTWPVYILSYSLVGACFFLFRSGSAFQKRRK